MIRKEEATSFVYGPYDLNTANHIRLDYVIDADGKTNTISYTSAGGYSYLISKVVDPYGRTNVFAYDQNGCLTNVTDVAGMPSAFVYDNNGWVTNLVTPYGTTIFTFTNGFFNGMDRAVIATEPNGSHQMFVFLYDASSHGVPRVYTDMSNMPQTPG